MALQSNYCTALHKFGQLGRQIEQFNFHVAAENLRGALNHLDHSCNEYSQIQRAAKIYQNAAADAKKYVRETKDFAEEIIELAEEVTPFGAEEVLDFFESTAFTLKEDFKVVVDQHETVMNIVRNAHERITGRQTATRRAIREAEEDEVCNIPVFGILTSPVVMAGKWSEEVDNPVGKVFAGAAGVVAGVVRGAASTALLGLPMAAAHSRKVGYEATLRQLQHTGEMLKIVYKTVCEHKSLLDEICNHLSDLHSSGSSIGDDFKRGKLVSRYRLKLAIKASDKLRQSCDKYLTSVAYY